MPPLQRRRSFGGPGCLYLRRSRGSAPPTTPPPAGPGFMGHRMRKAIRKTDTDPPPGTVGEVVHRHGPEHGGCQNGARLSEAPLMRRPALRRNPTGEAAHPGRKIIAGRLRAPVDAAPQQARAEQKVAPDAAKMWKAGRRRALANRAARRCSISSSALRQHEPARFPVATSAA
jgi:hypothetical protein